MAQSLNGKRSFSTAATHEKQTARSSNHLWPRVAGEVRNIAQRSGEAAEEIENLTQTGVKCVESGTALWESAGKTVSEVVASIRRVILPWLQ